MNDPRAVFRGVAANMSRIADVLGVDPIEIRLKNANRIGDTSPNGVVYTDPSTVPTILAVADELGHELPGDYRAMSSEPRSGEWLPEHLVGQVDVGQAQFVAVVEVGRARQRELEAGADPVALAAAYEEEHLPVAIAAKAGFIDEIVTPAKTRERIAAHFEARR